MANNTAIAADDITFVTATEHLTEAVKAVIVGLANLLAITATLGGSGNHLSEIRDLALAADLRTRDNRRERYTACLAGFNVTDPIREALIVSVLTGREITPVRGPGEAPIRMSLTWMCATYRDAHGV